MTHRVRRVCVLLVIAVVAGGALGYAQIAGSPRTSVDIEFTFMAGGKSMPAGTYTFEIRDEVSVLLSGPQGKMFMPVMTRLGRHDDDQEPELVFDKLGGVLHLSEVWLPGRDGYLLLGTKENHDHTILGGPRGKKK